MDTQETEAKIKDLRKTIASLEEDIKEQKKLKLQEELLLNSNKFFIRKIIYDNRIDYCCGGNRLAADNKIKQVNFYGTLYKENSGLNHFSFSYEEAANGCYGSIVDAEEASREEFRLLLEDYLNTERVSNFFRWWDE